MNNYTIYCTQEQTKKALNIGAPLKIGEGKETILCRLQNYHTYKRCVIPTAEQMIGWLEEQRLVLCIYPIYRDNDYCIGYKFSCEEIKRNMYSDIFITRKEATLAAIDAALEYLENLKQ